LSAGYGALELKAGYQRNLTFGFGVALLLVCAFLTTVFIAGFFHSKAGEGTPKRIRIELLDWHPITPNPASSSPSSPPPLPVKPPWLSSINANLRIEEMDEIWPETDIFIEKAGFGDRTDGLGANLNGESNSSDDTLLLNDGFDIKPFLLFKIESHNPALARNRRITGTVLAEFLVGTDGVVYRVSIKKTSNEIFDDPVKEALKQWIFRPMILRGRSFPFRIGVSVDFVIFR